MEAATGRVERRRARTANAILDAAEALLVERGVRGATIEAIADQADIAIATLYTHFGGKDDVLRALSQRAIERNASALDEALAQPASSAVERLVAIGDSYLAFHLANPSALRLLALSDLPGREATDAALGGLLRRVADALERDMAAGELRTDVDALRLVRFIWGAWNAAIALHARGSLSRAELRRTLDDGARVIGAGLTP